MTPLPFKALGVLPLCFFCAYAVSALRRGRAADSLWMCHLANLALALGLLAEVPGMVRLAAIWIVPGIPLWLLEMGRTGDVLFPSILSHLGGFAVGIYALSGVRMSPAAWLHGLLLYLCLQLVCRWVTPPALNVNLAHRIHDGWGGFPGGYKAYWIATTLLAAACLWGVGFLLMLVFRPAGGQ